MVNTKIKYQNTRILIEVMDVIQDKRVSLEKVYYLQGLSGFWSDFLSASEAQPQIDVGVNLFIPAPPPRHGKCGGELGYF